MDVAQKSKTLDAVDPASAKAKVLDIKVWGDPDCWKVLSKASSEAQGWMKSTKVMPIDGVGVLVQVSTQQRNLDGTYAIAEALEFVPSSKILEQKDGSGIVTNRTLRFA